MIRKHDTLRDEIARLEYENKEGKSYEFITIRKDKFDQIAKELLVNYESSKNDKQRKEDESNG